MLHPKLVDFLLKHHSQPDDVVLDPFCGSGVTLLQAARMNLFSLGCDINPLALLIAHTKSRRYCETELLRDFIKFKNSLLDTRDCDIPIIKNINYWYSDEVINELGRARAAIRSANLTYPNFFITNLAFIAREQSLTRNGEFKRYRVANPESSRQCQVIDKLILRSSELVQIFLDSIPPLVEPKPSFNNCEHGNPCGEKKFDLVISSPPYGDSGTTVAYGQYSSFGLEWSQDLNPFSNVVVSVDRDGLGKKSDVLDKVRSMELLASLISCISDYNETRANQVLWFFNGYFKALQNVVNSLNEGGRVCLIVGNRTVCGIQIPMDQITAEFLTSLGLVVRSITGRSIHNKVMPHSNSPSNRKGKSGPTMNREFIVFATLGEKSTCP